MAARTVEAQGANEFIELTLARYLDDLETLFPADCLTYVGPLLSGADDRIRYSVEAITNRKPKLLVMLETIGGFAEVARRISDTFRKHYAVVDFLIPSHAMSAGTILAMSGDAIHMDYYSVLGPIDPQVENQDGRLIPALGYLIRYEDLLTKANSGKITAAELNILLNFDQGDLYRYTQARDLSISLLEEWLVKYKFKDWTTTETHSLPVTLDMKKQRAREIAEELNNVRKWNSHGIGISAEVLRRELNLKIDDFGENGPLSAALRKYHRLLSDYMTKMGQEIAIHTREGYESLK
jgi:Serine dehydrogenase proteinase